MPPRLEIRYLSGHDVDRLAIGPDLILDATERALAAQGRGEVVLEPREHLVPDPAFDGHFNVLRAYVAPLDVAGVKVVGDYHGNYKLGLPSELALLTLYDPRTGVPRAILDATAITEWRTGAVTALGGRHLARAGAKVLGHVGARGTAFANVTPARPRPRLRRDPGHERAARVARGVRRAPARGARQADPRVRHDRGDGARRRRRRRGDPAHRARADPAHGVDRAGRARHAVRDDERGRALAHVIMDKVYVDDWGQCKSGRFGALRAHVEAGLVTGESIAGELGDVVAGTRPGRESDDERILFWHRGLATTDIALGQAILDRAVEQDVGTMLPYR